MTESKIQHEIVMWLQSQGIYFFSVPNEGSTSAIRTNQLKSLGLRPGTSDLVLLFPGRVVFVEVKTPTGRQSEYQRRFESKVKALGFEYYLVRSLSDVKAKIIIDVADTIV